MPSRALCGEKLFLHLFIGFGGERGGGEASDHSAAADLEAIGDGRAPEEDAGGGVLRKRKGRVGEAGARVSGWAGGHVTERIRGWVRVGGREVAGGVRGDGESRKGLRLEN
jgi:hypothetical protein